MQALVACPVSTNWLQLYWNHTSASVFSCSNFIEIALRHGCSPLNLLHIFRISFPKNTFGWLLLFLTHFWSMLVFSGTIKWKHLTRNELLQNWCDNFRRKASSQIFDTAQKMKFSIKDFFSKYDQIRRKLRIWSNLLKKSLMENFIFCAVWLKPKA